MTSMVGVKASEMSPEVSHFSGEISLQSSQTVMPDPKKSQGEKPIAGLCNEPSKWLLDYWIL